MRTRNRQLLILAVAIALLLWIAFMVGIDWGRSVGRLIFAAG